MHGLVDTCANFLAEGGSDMRGDFDAAIIIGAGFAALRGGSLHHVQARGLPKLRARLEAVEAQCGPRFRGPAEWAKLTA